MTKAHESVMNWVTEELRSGRLQVGDHLPGERALAEALGVSRSSTREALRVLEALGTIRTSTGSGPTSGTMVTAAPEQALGLALNLQLATSRVEHHHVYEVRLLLETWAAENAEVSRGEWDTAAHLLDRMDDPTIGLESFLALDAQFHVLLSRAAGNPLISTLMDALRNSIAEHTLSRARSLPDWTETSGRLRREHRAVFEALSTGASRRAAKLLSAHIRGYYLETSEHEDGSAD